MCTLKGKPSSYAQTEWADQRNCIHITATILIIVSIVITTDEMIENWQDFY